MLKYIFCFILVVLFSEIYEGKASENEDCDERFSRHKIQEKPPEISVERSYLNELPSEIIVHIVKFIETEDFKNLSIVSHSFLTHFQNESFLKSYLPILSGSLDEYKHRLLPVESRVIPVWGSLFRAATDEKFLNLFNNSYFELKKNPKSEKLNSITSLTQSTLNLNLIPIEISRLNNLQKLYLSNNNLKELPTEFSSLKNLKELSLNNNRLCVFPSPIYDIISLEKLSLTSNKIEHVSDEITSLINLKHFYLDGNKIKEFSTNFVYLPNIERLHFNRNQIKEIPIPEMGISKKLQYLGLLGNPLERGFEKLEIIKKTYGSIIFY